MPKDTTKYRIRAGKHERREGNEFVTYRAGDEIEVTDAEVKAFPNKFEPIGGSDGGEIARLRRDLAEAHERIAELEAAAGVTTEGSDGEPPDGERAYPEGEPSEDWTKPQIEAYAVEHSIELPSGGTKAEYLQAISDAK